MSQNLYLGGLKSGEFHGLSIISLWGKIKMLPILHKLTENSLFYQDHGDSPYL